MTTDNPTPSQYRKKSSDKPDPIQIHPSAQQFFNSMEVVHTAVRRGFEQIIENAESVKTGNIKAFMGYVESCLVFLQYHHDHEEKIIFPALKDCFPETEHLSEEHSRMAIMLDSLVKYAHNVRSGAAPWNCGEFGKQIKELQELCKSHFRTEESCLTPVRLTQEYTNQLLKELGEKIGKTAMSEPGKTTQFSFFLTQMSQDDFEKMFPSMPFVPRNVVFPTLTKVNSSFWRYSKTHGGLSL